MLTANRVKARNPASELSNIAEVSANEEEKRSKNERKLKTLQGAVIIRRKIH